LIHALDCPGGVCQRPQSQRLKVQSLNDEPTPIKDLVVNDRPGWAFINGVKDVTMMLGDVRYVIVRHEPVRVRIVTDRGEKTYNFD
jgi:hypothetical protein